MWQMTKEFDYIIIGSGFGGSVSALRLSEKGYRVLVIEKGKRWRSSDFPTSNWNIRKYLWIPLLRCFGFQKLSFFREVFILSGVGVGGGSLVYANTHMMPKEKFYRHPIWAHMKDWKSVLAPYFVTARRMLGSARYEKEGPEDRVLQEVATDMGRGHTYGRVDYVGVYLGDPTRATDPYFNGLGPLRKGCIECAGCMVGCRHEAKNTLDKNYLWLAEHVFGATVLPETEVTKIRFGNDRYTIETKSSTHWWRKSPRSFESGGVVVSGGVLGTLNLLLRQKHIYRTLPHLSDRLGGNVLTNSEMLSGVVAANRKMNHGLAISSIFDADDDTHIELCKFPNGSGAMVRLAVMAAGSGSPVVRTAKMLGNIVMKPVDFLRSLFHWRVAERSIIFLIMQTLPNAMQMKLTRGWLGTRLKFDNASHQKVPSFIGVGQEALERYAGKVGGVPQNAATEVFFGLASTAHILGGCPIGNSATTGVVNDRFEAFGYPRFHILDGTIVPCNLGVNPSLTITALSEYAMDQIPARPGARLLEDRLRDRATAAAVAGQHT